MSTLCLTGKKAYHSMYFANVRSTPTTCVQAGSYLESRPNQISVKTGEGVCENGREIDETSFLCVVGGADTMPCLIDDAKESSTYARVKPTQSLLRMAQEER